MTAQDQSAEREAFQEWTRSLPGVDSSTLYRRDMPGASRFGDYVSFPVQRMWQAWQARAALSAREAQAQAGVADQRIDAIFKERASYLANGAPYILCDKDTFCEIARALLSASPARIEVPQGRKLVKIKPPKADKWTYGHCENNNQPGGCQMPNVHCGYPECDRLPATLPTQHESPK